MHKCYMTTPLLKADKIKDVVHKYLFFDFESMCVDNLQDLCKDNNCCIGMHHFNYVFAMDLTGKI